MPWVGERVKPRSEVGHRTVKSVKPDRTVVVVKMDYVACAEVYLSEPWVVSRCPASDESRGREPAAYLLQQLLYSRTVLVWTRYY